MNNKDVAITLYKAILKNYEILVDRAWDVTKHYIEMEQQENNKSLS